MIYKTLYSIVKIEQYKPYLKKGVNSGAHEG
jgi:hypothetical protein